MINQMLFNKTFFKYIFIGLPLIVAMATIQHMFVMKLAFTPRFYTVPVLAAIIFCAMGAKITKLLGDKKDLIQFKSDFNNWKSIRDEVLNLASMGKHSEAYKITKGNG